jgi:hypothetical protein
MTNRRPGTAVHIVALYAVAVTLTAASAVAQEPPSDAACPAGTAKEPRSNRCLAECPDGRLEVAPGQCCWPGQDVGAATGRCLGAVAYCPRGTLPNPRDAEDCVRLCLDGRIEVGAGHCCWPGQTWGDQACVGAASCPKHRVADPRHPTECVRLCSGGRLEVVPGHCCQPGETWNEEAQKCGGAALCMAGTMANPRDVSECLNVCNRDGLEVAPGHCCWPGQQWNIDREECAGPALACSAHMRLSPHGECLSVDGPCETNLDCDAGSACLAGACTPGHRFRGIEVFADAVPLVLGDWHYSNDGGIGSDIASGHFSLRGGAGLAVRASWAIHPRWSVGGYFGYLRVSDGQVKIDHTNGPADVPLAVHFRAVRLGGFGNYRWPVNRAFACGLGLEGGLTIGTGSGAGGEIGPDFFFDVPLSSAASRAHLMLSLGFRAGIMEHQVKVSGSKRVVDWYYFMPVLRLGLAFGG